MAIVATLNGPAPGCLAFVPGQIGEAVVLLQVATGAAARNLDSLSFHHALDFSGVAGVDVRRTHCLLEQRVVRPDSTSSSSTHDAAILANHFVGVDREHPPQLPPFVVKKVGSLSASLRVRP